MRWARTTRPYFSPDDPFFFLSSMDSLIESSGSADLFANTLCMSSLSVAEIRGSGSSRRKSFSALSIMSRLSPRNLNLVNAAPS